MAELIKTKCNDTFNIDPRRIEVRSGFNCRINFDLDELVASIKENGVLNPITVTESKNADGEVVYLLVDGERRYRAVMQAIEEGADIRAIRATIVPNLSEAELLEQQVIRNQGKPFNEYEYGKFVYKMTNMGYSIAEIARKLGKNSGAVTYMRQVLDWPLELQELVKTDKISAAEVRRINALNNHDIETTTKEIIEAFNGAKEKGKERITSKDLTGKTLTAKNSKLILKGLQLLMEAMEKYVGDNEINITPVDIMEQLKAGKLIDEILTESVQQQFKKAE